MQVYSGMNFSGTSYILTTDLVVMLEHQAVKRHAIWKHCVLTHVFDIVLVMSFLYLFPGEVHLSSQLFKGNHVRSPSRLAQSSC